MSSIVLLSRKERLYPTSSPLPFNGPKRFSPKTQLTILNTEWAYQTPPYLWIASGPVTVILMEMNSSRDISQLTKDTTTQPNTDTEQQTPVEHLN